PRSPRAVLLPSTTLFRSPLHSPRWQGVGRRDGVVRKVLRKRRLLRLALIVAGAVIAVVAALFGVAWALTPIPDSTQADATAQGSDRKSTRLNSSHVKISY